MFSIKVDASEVVKLNKCIDGDTFKAVYNNEIITVRLLAIDTPETKHPTKNEEAYGKQASEFTCEKLTNAKKIELEFDNNSDLQDKYGRYLAWVFVDGKLLASEIIKKGYGKIAYLYGDYKYTSMLEIVQLKAQSSKIGIWSENNLNYNYLIIIVIILLIMYFTKILTPKKIIKILKSILLKK